MISRQQSVIARHKLQLSINNNVLPYNMTMYQAIKKYGTVSFNIILLSATNSASGGRGAALQTLLVGVGVQHYKLCLWV